MTTKGTTELGRIAVYGTNGEEFFPDPENGTKHPDVGEWFLTTGLRGYVYTQPRKLMVYLGEVRHPYQSDQVFAVYEGADSDIGIFEEFRRAIRTKLQKEADWELVESTSTTDAKSLYHLLVEAGGSRSQEIRLSDYTDHTEKLINDVLISRNTNPILVRAGDYRIAALLLRSYAELTPCRIHVYEEPDPQIPGDVDLAISVDFGPYEVKIPPASESLLEKLHRERERKRTEERIDQTVEALTDHAENSDDVSVVEEAIQEGLQDGYGSFELIAQEEREQMERELSETKEKLSERKSEIETLQRDLQDHRNQIDQLQKDAAISRALGRLKRGMRSPSSIFLTEREKDRIYERRNTNGGQNMAAVTEQPPSVADQSTSSKKVIWSRVVLLILILLSIALGATEVLGYSILDVIWVEMGAVFEYLRRLTPFTLYHD